MSNNSKKVSVIVPVYNAEQYLTQTLGNLVHQTLEGIEIIIVNDASTDNSLSILMECERQFPEKIMLINSDINRGAGGARNVGLDYATGEYIGFADCDDIVATDMYEKLYNTAKEHNADIVDSGYIYEKDGGAILHTSDDLTGVLDAKKRSGLIVSGGYIVSRIFKRQLIEDPRLRFRERVILEDADFLTYLLATAGSIYNVKEILYCYKDRPDSLSKLQDTNKYYTNITEAMSAIYDKTYRLSNYDDIKDAVEYEILQMYSYGVNILLHSYKINEKSSDEVLSLLTKIASLKKELISGGYNNSYVQNKINTTDIQIMKLNDIDSEKLLQLL